MVAARGGAAIGAILKVPKPPDWNSRMPTLSRIQDVQGTGLYSPLSGKIVRVRGVVTEKIRQGFFLQDPDPVQSASQDLVQKPQPAASGIFVFVTDLPTLPGPLLGALVEVSGVVLDFAREENERPTTQIELHEIAIIQAVGPTIAPIWLNSNTVPSDAKTLAVALNNLEAMRVGIRAGALFSAPSNPFGDYVMLPTDMAKTMPVSAYGTAVLDAGNPDRWLPGFRIAGPDTAPLVNVGDVLLTDVIGPMNYRAGSYQILARGPLKVERIEHDLLTVAHSPGLDYTSILTLNAFNLDTQLEREALVDDPRRDIDHDVADLRFEKLAAVIVKQAGAPAIIALQEIQDNDGAELSAVTDASYTFERLIQAAKKLGGPLYQWADIAPENGADGGQPGGNIRNAYLFDPQRVALVAGSLQRIGDQILAFDGSRKALMAHFRILSSNQILAVINVHLASKRHQNSIFAPNAPGFDAKEAQRILQAKAIRDVLAGLDSMSEKTDYYVTGDFNDFDFSETLKALCGDASVNLMQTVAQSARYDYNHRGKLHTLMHAIVSKRQAEPGRFKFEILHGNELTGVQPGTMGTRATDHAYVISHLRVGQ
jgi:uncharacterized protein